MLELKHVSYSYQSYQEEIFSDVNYQFKMGHFTALSVSLEQGNRPSSPSWLVWTIPRRGRFSLMGRTSRPKGLATTTKHHVSLVFQIIIWLIIWRHWKMSAWSTNKLGKTFSLELGLDETQIKPVSSATIRRAATTGGYCACARFRSTCHLSRWADRNLDEQTAGDIIAILKKLAKERQNVSSSSPWQVRWSGGPPMWSWNWVAVASLRRGRGMLCCAMLLPISHGNGPSPSCSLPSFSSWGPWGWSDSPALKGATQKLHRKPGIHYHKASMQINPRTNPGTPRGTGNLRGISKKIDQVGDHLPPSGGSNAITQIS